MTFTIRAGVTTCDTCRQPVAPGWQAKTAHVCPRGNPHEYTTALIRADAQQVDAAGYCPQGHRAAGNTYVDKNGHVVCNACRRDRYAARRYERGAS